MATTDILAWKNLNPWGQNQTQRWATKQQQQPEGWLKAQALALALRPTGSAPATPRDGPHHSPGLRPIKRNTRVSES